MMVVVYFVHPEHVDADATEVRVVKIPFELVVTSTTPVKVPNPPVGSAEVKVVVYFAHPEHGVPEAAITDVSVVKMPLEFVVMSTTPVKVARELSELSEVNVVVYSVQPEHSDDADSGRTDVRVVKIPLEFVVTSMIPVKVTSELWASREVKVEVNSVQPEHTEAADLEITDVVVVKAPFEFVVTSTTPVKVSIPPEESAEVKVVVYSEHPEHSERTEVSVTKTPFEFVVTSILPVTVSSPPVESVEIIFVVYSVHPEHQK
ncbi:hypothetical protein CLUG_05605, partial [Clavispora lusitaniae ATCC 42720]